MVYGEPFFSAYKDLHPTIFLGIPENYDAIHKYIESSQYRFAHKKWFLCSGKPLCEDVALGFYKKFDVWINQVYGMMETSTISANLRVNKANYLSVGTPVNNVIIQFDSFDNNKSEGTILIKSETLSPEYITSEKSIKLPLSNGFFNTGDLGKRDSEGNIFIVARESKGDLL